MKKLAILKDKGKGNHGGSNPLVKENILLLTENRLSKYTNDVPFLTANDVPQTVEQLTVAGADETADLTYYAYATNFPVVNKFYAATPKTVDLNVGDATHGRVDLIIANKPDTVGGMGYITKSEGTPSLTPSPNNIDSATQYIIKWIFVGQNATVGVDVTPPPLSATPTLQQVLDAGNTADAEIIIEGDIGNLSYIDFQNVSVQNGDLFIGMYADTNGAVLNYSGSGFGDLRVLANISTTNNEIYFPDKSGTIALSNLQKEINTSYSVLDSDNEHTIFLNSATPITVTINTLTKDNFSCDFYNLGVGAVTFVNGTATVGYPDGTVLNTDKVCSLIRFMATTTYKLKGELV